jgi:hypothetical protein
MECPVPFCPLPLQLVEIKTVDGADYVELVCGNSHHKYMSLRMFKTALYKEPQPQ